MGSAARAEGVREHLRVEVDCRPLVFATAKVKVSNLSKASELNGEPILRGVSLEIAAGTVAGIIGPSGSGKSTLLRVLNRLWEPAPGTIFLSTGRSACSSSSLPSSTVLKHVTRWVNERQGQGKHKSRIWWGKHKSRTWWGKHKLRTWYREPKGN